MTTRAHEYRTKLTWEGDTGEGTANYRAYQRRYRLTWPGKPDLLGSADAAFRGDATLHNPEDLFVASIAACHMLFFLSLCAKQGICVVGYEDEARGTMMLEPGGGGRFTGISLHPRVTISDGDPVQAARLHDEAHALCFLANSCSVPIAHAAVVRCV
jgi:organic hydroperoxide reductase OsmC/OhrA